MRNHSQMMLQLMPKVMHMLQIAQPVKSGRLELTGSFYQQLEALSSEQRSGTKTRGKLLKIDLAEGEEVKLIEVAGGPLTFGDGLALLSPTKLVVAGNPSDRLVESSDGWETASLDSSQLHNHHRIHQELRLLFSDSESIQSRAEAAVLLKQLNFPVCTALSI
ncbi:hypothetical protein DVH24_027331 [Malus domestica]|uniref:Uncharacterized protein n=1 Tax=Malus domestica TaxID=3750 RepID=A0A498IR99_MALDO|nr:hypothetical protein DVH24_027331 [Malus domestica]